MIGLLNMKIFTVTAKGGRPYQEDRSTTFRYTYNNIVWVVTCMFDGHGGAGVSQFLVENIETIFKRVFTTHGHHDVPNSLRKLYSTLDQQIGDMPFKNNGSTATITIITPGKIYFSNIGDSEGFVSLNNIENPIVMTIEDKVDSEKERITKAGGAIEYSSGMARIHGLNLSRSFGDYYVKKWVISQPHIKSISTNNIDFIYQATDGIWDVLTHDNVYNMISDVQKNKRDKTLVESTIRTALNSGSMDNITATLVVFN